MSGSLACRSTATASTAAAIPTSTVTRTPARSRQHSIMISEIVAKPASVTTSDVVRSVRPCRMDSAASACSTGPELESRAAHDDLLALQAGQGLGLAAQHVDIGDDRDTGWTNAEVDQE